MEKRLERYTIMSWSKRSVNGRVEPFLICFKLRLLVNETNCLIINFKKGSIIIIYIYNPVVTCRHITISTSASEARNAKKIAAKKVSDIDVSMFGPEL